MSNDTIAAQGAQPSSSDKSSGASRASRAASVSGQLPSEAPTPCFRCHQEIYQSFFFDGFAQSLQDKERLSNIARLFQAHEETDNSLGIYAMYYEGMGRDLSGQTVGVVGKAASDTASALAKEAEGKFITDPAKKVASGIGKSTLDGPASKTLGKR